MEIMWLVPFILAGLLLGGVWVGAALGLTGFIGLYLGGGTVALGAGVIAVWNLMYNYSLVAFPLYVFLGELFVASGLAKRSYDAISPLLERVPGKLLVSNVVVDTLFGAIVGSSMATAAIVGSIAYPELSRRGYDKRALVGNLAGAGTLGSFVPPSMALIIYAAWVDVSIGGCFAAALVPALITSGLFIIYLAVLCSVRHDIAPSASKIVPWLHAIVATRSVWPIVILIVSIMGTIYFGIATPTESAGLACVITLVMCVAFKTFSFAKLRQTLMSTARTCGMVLFIMAGAMIFSVSLSVIGLPRHLVVWMGSLGLPDVVIIGFVYLLYLILGCCLDFTSMMLMTLPFVFPLMMSIGVDPLWLGIVVVITGEMGLLTPPVGLNLYVLQAVTHGEASLGEVAKGSIPYFLLLGVTLGLITIFPQLCTWLPAHML